MRKTHRVAFCKLQRRQLKSGVHGVRRLAKFKVVENIRQDGVLLCLCRILCTSWVTVGLGVVIGVDRIRVILESNSCSLGLPYNVEAPHVVTHDDLIAIGTQGEPAACAGA